MIFELPEPHLGFNHAHLTEVIHGHDRANQRSYLKLNIAPGRLSEDGQFIRAHVRPVVRWIQGPELEDFFDAIPTPERGDWRREDLVRWVQEQGLSSPYRVIKERYEDIENPPVKVVRHRKSSKLRRLWRTLNSPII